MTSKAYKSLLIESAVADIKKIEVFKTPADAIIASTRKGDVENEVTKTRDATDAISVLGRIYDAHDNDRPLIENDEEHEAQGDSEISVELPDNAKNAKIQDIADVIPDDAGTVANPDQQDQFKKALPDEAADLGLDESFVLEDDEEGDGDLPEDEEEDDVCPECGKNPCECDTGSEGDVAEEEDETLPEDEVTEPVEGDDGEVVATELPEDDEPVEDEGDTLPDDEEPVEDEIEDESCQEEDETLPEDEEPVEDTSVEGEDQGVGDTEPVEGEDEDNVATEDVDDSTLDEVEQTGSDELLAGGEGDQVPAEPIEKDGEVYEGAEEGDAAVADPAIDPNIGGEEGDASVDPAQTVDDNAAAATEGDAAIDPNDQAAEGEDQNAADPVLDIDSQVVASDTTQESVLESLMRSFRETSDEGYMSYEADDSEGDAD